MNIIKKLSALLLTLTVGAAPAAAQTSSGAGVTFTQQTSGAVLYGSGGAGVSVADPARFFWDTINFRLGINNNSPSYALDVTGSGRFTGGVIGASYSGGAITGTTGTFSGAITGASYSGGAISGTSVTGTSLAITSAVSAGIVLTSADTNLSLLTRGTSKGIRVIPTTAFISLEGVDQTGTGSYQPLRVGGSTLALHSGGTDRWSLDSSGFFYPGADATYDIGYAANRVRAFYGLTGQFDTSVFINNASAVIRIGAAASSGYLDIYRDSPTGYFIYNSAQATPFRGHKFQLGGVDSLVVSDSGVATGALTSTTGVFSSTVTATNTFNVAAVTNPTINLNSTDVNSWKSVINFLQSGTIKWQIGADVNDLGQGNLFFYDAISGSTRAFFDASGLNVTGSGVFSAGLNTTTGVFSSTLTRPNGIIGSTSGVNFRYGIDGNGLYFTQYASGVAVVTPFELRATSGYVIMPVALGIGSTSPDAKLTIQEAGAAQITLKNAAGTTKSYIGTIGAFGSAGTDDLRIRSDGAAIVLGFSGTEYARLTTTGLGLGGTPVYQLDIMSNANSTSGYRQVNASTGASSGVSFLQDVGGRYTTRHVGYTGQWLIENGVNIVNRYSDFDTHYWRNTAGTNFAQLSSSGIFTIYNNGNPSLQLSAAAATYRYIRYSTSGVGRFDVGLLDGAESGSNAGSDFYIARSNDAGTSLGVAMNITRATGRVGINVTPLGKLHVAEIDGNTVGLFSGASKGVRFVPAAGSFAIEGVDYTGTGSFQPLVLGGSVLQFTLSGTAAININANGAFYPQTDAAGNQSLGVSGATWNGIYVTLANSSTTSAVCYNTSSKLFTYNGTAGECTVSALKYKDRGKPVTGALASLVTLNRLEAWTYKKASGLSDGLERVGLYADDVEKMDKRCATYKDGKLENYDTRCVLGYAVMAIKELKADNDNLRAEMKKLATKEK